MVVAEYYSRLFFRNSIDGAFYPPLQSKKRICDQVCTGDHLIIDINKNKLENLTQKKTYELLPIGEVIDILEAGGIFEYAKKNALLS